LVVHGGVVVVVVVGGGVVVAGGVVVGGGALVVVVVVVVGGVGPLHVTPFSVNPVGAVNDPVHRPLYPIWVDPPVARDPFHDMFVADSAVPEAVQLADHPWVKLCPLGRVTASVHEVIGSPVLATVRFAV
jgi:hypothetical protein